MEENTEMHTFSTLANAAYNFEKYGFERTQNELQDHLPDYELIKELSDDKSVVAESPTDINIAYRGTSGLGDIGPDATIALGLTDIPFLKDVRRIFGAAVGGRFNDAQLKYDKVKQLYPDKQIKLTGHSLGGAQALALGRHNNAEGYAFNPGSSFGAPFHALYQSIARTEKPQTIYTTSKDLISGASAIFDRITDRVIHQPTNATFGSIGAHSLSHFLPPKKILSIPALIIQKLSGKTGGRMAHFNGTPLKPLNYYQTPSTPFCKINPHSKRCR
jgi:hypothetical protein